jgi:hypothetical protein
MSLVEITARPVALLRVTSRQPMRPPRSWCVQTVVRDVLLKLFLRRPLGTCFRHMRYMRTEAALNLSLAHRL